ncbi:MAG: acyltransferase [Roseiflexus sp.]|nr:acyltransferase [Roseiflexus sp.]MCS7288425.1 acyltransferase [Roseiflexus sp.]MDW8146792.1 acyltransferase [Roseiflexaceae bacterium]MDW8234155.1 acyltransferase [Roseiflexaceae bacterium]
MMRPLFIALILLAPPSFKPWLMRVLLGARIGRNVRIGWFAGISARHIAIGDESDIRALTFISCHGDVIIGRYSIISSFVLAYGAADLIIGDHAYIGPQTFINCDENVRIGNYSALGARCMIYTHGSFFPYTEGYWVKFGPVTIGDYVWCAAGVFIHPGVTIGDHVFVNSRSVVTRDVASGDAVEGFPAQAVTSMDRLKRSMSPRRRDAAARQILDHFVELGLRRELRLDVRQCDGQVAFRYRGKQYRLLCIPSDGDPPSFEDGHAYRVVALVTRPDWTPPAGAAVYPLDLIAYRTPRSNDPIHHALRIFLMRYYGVQIEYAPAE